MVHVDSKRTTVTDKGAERTPYPGKTPMNIR